MRNAALSAMLVAGLAVSVLFTHAANADEKASPKKDQGGSGILVTIAKDTTYITEPLRKDGYPNYATAIDQRWQQGVTPENNSAVLFWQAIGPKGIDESYRKQYFKLLGIATPPLEGDYFSTPEDYVKSHSDAKKRLATPSDPEGYQTLWHQQTVAAQRPWSSEEFPALAGWLAANEKPFALLIEASKRPRRYDPCFALASEAPPNTATFFAIPVTPQYRMLVRMFPVRVNLRLQEGDVDKAWQDLLTVHRLARLSAQSPWPFDSFNASSFEGIACDQDRALIEHAKATAQQLDKMRKDLASLPPMPEIAGKFDACERMYRLDVALFLARNRAPLTTFTDSPSPDAVVQSLLAAVGDAKIDWDVALRTINAWYDRLVAAMRNPTHRARMAALKKLDEEFRGRAKAAAQGAGQSPQIKSECVGLIFIKDGLSISSTAVNAQDHTATSLRLTELAFALAQYHVEHSSYPEKLADLVPKYVATVPNDVFNDASLHYRREPSGYLLYSVGVNGKDDGGVGYEYGKQSIDVRQGDDQVIRVPAAKK